MSLLSNAAPLSIPTSSRRWLRFSLRSLLIVMTLLCAGIVAKQRSDWWRWQQLIHAWIAPLVELARAAEGDITRYPDDPPQLTPPAGLPAEEQIPLLRAEHNLDFTEYCKARNNLDSITNSRWPIPMEILVWPRPVVE